MNDRTARTTEVLRATALRLFREHGFDGVTVEQIASAAGVSHMTFFRHFGTKEAVLMDDPYDPYIAEAVAAQPTRLRPLERVRRGLLTAWEAAPETTPEETRARVRIIAGHPGLRARAWQNTQLTQDAIVNTLVGQGTARDEAVAAAGACLGAVTAALLEWGSAPSDSGLGQRIVATLGVLTVEAPE